jgi:prefoldin subunit 1
MKLSLICIPCSRFVNVPIDTVNKRLARESGEASSEITNLEKKLHYHETTHKNSRENFEQILKSGGRA